MPDSPIGIISTVIVFVGANYKLVKWIMGWGKDTDKWDRAANALEKLSKDVSELLFEIRGVNGKGGINERLEKIEEDVAAIQTRNTEADVLVEMYKLELQQRAEEGKPFRRQMDRVLTSSTQPTEG